jgi:hypothetical protein
MRQQGNKLASRLEREGSRWDGRRPTKTLRGPGGPAIATRAPAVKCTSQGPEGVARRAGALHMNPRPRDEEAASTVIVLGPRGWRIPLKWRVDRRLRVGARARGRHLRHHTHDRDHTFGVAIGQATAPQAGRIIGVAALFCG